MFSVLFEASVYLLVNHIISSNRHQTEISCLEDFIEQDNPVRFIDAFVDKLDLHELGFIIYTILGIKDFIEKIKNWTPNYKGISIVHQLVNYFKRMTSMIIFENIFPSQKMPSCNEPFLIFTFK